MVVDANHELFSHVGVIGHRTQVIQVVSPLVHVSFRATSTNISILLFRITTCISGWFVSA